jgi:hypothetical protein
VQVLVYLWLKKGYATTYLTSENEARMNKGAQKVIGPDF